MVTSADAAALGDLDGGDDVDVCRERRGRTEDEGSGEKRGLAHGALPSGVCAKIARTPQGPTKGSGRPTSPHPRAAPAPRRPGRGSRPRRPAPRPRPAARAQASASGSDAWTSARRPRRSGRRDVAAGVPGPRRVGGDQVDAARGRGERGEHSLVVLVGQDPEDQFHRPRRVEHRERRRQRRRAVRVVRAVEQHAAHLLHAPRPAGRRDARADLRLPDPHPGRVEEAQRCRGECRVPLLVRAAQRDRAVPGWRPRRGTGAPRRAASSRRALHRLRRLGARHHGRHAALEDAGLLPRDGVDPVAQELHVVEADAGHRGDQRASRRWWRRSARRAPPRPPRRPPARAPGGAARPAWRTRSR